MANNLNTDKQIAIIAALAEGSSIRSIERITGVHRDTIMRLGVKIGQGCKALMDFKLQNLPCTRLETDDPENPKQHVTVLHIPPAVSPITAVRVAIMQELKELRANADIEAEA
jgi:hypothetical protein